MSLDSGTRKTFAQIKGVDCFDKVKNNIRKYSKNGRVVLKYIILPNVNDNIDDIKGFLSFAKEIGTDSIEIVRNYLEHNNMHDNEFDFQNFNWSNQTMKLIKLFFNLCIEEKFVIQATNFPQNYKEVLNLN